MVGQDHRDFRHCTRLPLAPVRNRHRAFPELFDPILPHPGPLRRACCRYRPQRVRSASLSGSGAQSPWPPPAYVPALAPDTSPTGRAETGRAKVGRQRPQVPVNACRQRTALSRLAEEVHDLRSFPAHQGLDLALGRRRVGGGAKARGRVIPAYRRSRCRSQTARAATGAACAPDPRVSAAGGRLSRRA